MRYGTIYILLFLYKDLTASIYIKLLAPLATFIYIDTIVDSVLRGLDAQVGVMIINILDLVISTSFIYFVVPKLGIIGYIISIYLSEIFNFIASFVLLSTSFVFFNSSSSHILLYSSSSSL